MKPVFPAVTPLHASLVFLALACVLPFLQWHHQLPITSFYSEWIAFVLGLLAALPLLTARYWQPLQLPRSTLFLLALLALLMVQVMLNQVPYPQQAFVAALYLLWALIMLWLGQQISRVCGLETLARWLAWALWLGALLSSAAALIQYFNWHTPFNRWIDRPEGAVALANLGQKNQLANYLALGLSAVLYLYASRAMSRWLTIPSLMLMLLVLAMTSSRAAWLYVLGVLALAWWWQRRAEPDTQIAAGRVWHVSLWIVPLFVLAQAVLYLPALHSPSGATLTPTERLFTYAGDTSVRLSLLREAFQMWQAHPLLGAGFGQFSWQHFLLASTPALTQSPLLPNTVAGGLFNHSHNLLAQVAAELGTLGLLVLLGALVYWLWGWRKQTLSLAHWWAAAVLLIIGLHSMLEYPLWYAYFLGLAALLIGATDQGTLRLRLSGLGRGAFGIMLVLAWISAINLADTYSRLEGLFRQTPPPEVAEIERTLEAVRNESVLTPYSEFAYAAGIGLDAHRLQDKLALNSAVMHFAPTSDVVYRHTILLALQGEPDAAWSMLQRAMVMYPGGVEEYLAITATLEPGVRERVEPLRQRAAQVLQEWKQHEIHTR